MWGKKLMWQNGKRRMRWKRKKKWPETKKTRNQQEKWKRWLQKQENKAKTEGQTQCFTLWAWLTESKPADISLCHSSFCQQQQQQAISGEWEPQPEYVGLTCFLCDVLVCSTWECKTAVTHNVLLRYFSTQGFSVKFEC